MKLKDVKVGKTYLLTSNGSMTKGCYSFFDIIPLRVKVIEKDEVNVMVEGEELNGAIIRQTVQPRYLKPIKPHSDEK